MELYSASKLPCSSGLVEGIEEDQHNLKVTT